MIEDRNETTTNETEIYSEYKRCEEVYKQKLSTYSKGSDTGEIVDVWFDYYNAGEACKSVGIVIDDTPSN